MNRVIILLATAPMLFGCCGSGPSVEEIAIGDATAIAGAADIAAAPSDWPWWRGPTLDGAIESAPPVTFNAAENVIWQLDLPGRGHCSPIVCGEHIFLTTANDAQQTQSLICLARTDGAERWTTQIHQGQLPPMHNKNSHASSTPACDGERVFTVFAVDNAVWLSAVDLAGNIVWQKEVGPFSSKHGYGASPVLYKSAVIVAADHHGQGYIAALDRRTGNVLWRKPRLYGASFATPVIAHVAGRDQLLLSGQDRVVSYDPATGEEIWWCSGSADSTANTMAFSANHVFATGGWHQQGVLCIRADGTGDVTDSHIEWEVTGMKVYVPSPVVAGDILVAARDDGIVVGIDINTGDIYWKKRLERGVGISASPTLVTNANDTAGVIYLPNEAGDVFVFRPTKDFEHLATNSMGEPIYASPVIVDGRIYLRTFGKLYCIGAK